jgi:hypothetical protein
MSALGSLAGWTSFIRLLLIPKRLQRADQKEVVGRIDQEFSIGSHANLGQTRVIRQCWRFIVAAAPATMQIKVMIEPRASVEKPVITCPTVQPSAPVEGARGERMAVTELSKTNSDKKTLYGPGRSPPSACTWPTADT